MEPERSGSAASLVAWDTLGRQGRIFTGWAPSAEQINEFTGGGARTPIRAYVGLKAAETLVKEGFAVMVYCADDPIQARMLEDFGYCAFRIDMRGCGERAREGRCDASIKLPIRRML